jgi:hypothetical protein
MAKALKTIADGIWLKEALRIAAEALGSEKFAKAQIRQWLASGALPWDCLVWLALDADGIAKTQRYLNSLGVVHPILAPSGPYRKGDPALFANERTEIDFENNSAREGDPTTVADGARAEGLKVSAGRLRALLRALLPESAPEPEEPALEPEDERAFKELYGNRTARAELPRVEMMRREISKRLATPYSKRSMERLLKRLREAAARR